MKKIVATFIMTLLFSLTYQTVMAKIISRTVTTPDWEPSDRQEMTCSSQVINYFSGESRGIDCDCVDICYQKMSSIQVIEEDDNGRVIITDSSPEHMLCVVQLFRCKMLEIKNDEEKPWEIDTDNDGCPDYIEDTLGTDPENLDSHPSWCQQ